MALEDDHHNTETFIEATQADELSGQGSQGPGSTIESISSEPGRSRATNYHVVEQICSWLATARANSFGESKRDTRWKLAREAYPALIRTLAAECAAQGLTDVCPNDFDAEGSARIRVSSPDPGYIYKKGSDLRAAVRKCLVAFGIHYPKVSKNDYSPSTGDPTGSRTWEQTETQLYQNKDWGVPQSLHQAVKHILRLFAPDSPFRTQHVDLATFISRELHLNPLHRVVVDDRPTRREIRSEMRAAAQNPPRRSIAEHGSYSGIEGALLQRLDKLITLTEQIVGGSGIGGSGVGGSGVGGSGVGGSGVGGSGAGGSGDESPSARESAEPVTHDEASCVLRRSKRARRTQPSDE